LTTVVVELITLRSIPARLAVALKGVVDDVVGAAKAATRRQVTDGSGERRVGAVDETRSVVRCVGGDVALVDQRAAVLAAEAGRTAAAE
jgi:hypothetical protein